MNKTNSRDGRKEEFSKFKSIELPRNVVLGKNAIENVGETCDKLELKKNAIIVCDSVTKKVAGDRVADILSENDYEVKIREIDDADQKNVDQITGEIEDETGFLLGVGGGKPIDVAKYSSYLDSIEAGPSLTPRTSTFTSGKDHFCKMLSLLFISTLSITPGTT